MKALVLLLFLCAITVSVYYTNRWLIALTRPRQSFLRFLCYLAGGLATAFVYTAIFAWLLLKLVQIGME